MSHRDRGSGSSRRDDRDRRHDDRHRDSDRYVTNQTDKTSINSFIHCSVFCDYLEAFNENLIIDF